MRNRISTALAAAAFSLTTLLAASAQAQSPQNRIAQSFSADSARSPIANNIHPRALHAQDLGTLDATRAIDSVSVRFSLTDAQNKALDQLLSDQANPASARYHQWLTPEAYAAQFGLSDDDLAKVTAYLKAQGLTVTGVARSHTFVTVSGTAAAMDRAFDTTLHSLTANGEKHFSNLTAPRLPTGIAAVVSGITGLSDFHLQPHVRSRVVPAYTSSISGSHFLAPGDIYTIYDISPLLTNSINGTGITIGVMGQTDIQLSSVAAFRSASGLTVNAPTVKLYGTDPGTSANDTEEAYLDVEWSGAVAPQANILYVNSKDVVGVSLTQSIDNNIAPILAISYGDCEAGFGAANIATYQALFRQANAQGQTIVGPAGDSGATDCDYNATVATSGLAVDFPASSPNVTGVGGTMLNEGTGTYFNATNNANGGSAISYIPEAVWNETATYGALASGGGGASNYFTKPTYQLGAGVPNDSARDVPDLALSSAVLHDGFLICIPTYCTNGYRNSASNLSTVGGTSVATPMFAGMLALLEQKIAARVGNANPVIYGLANSTYSTAVFHDVTAGNNAQPCTAGTVGCPNGGSIGFNAGAGYDQATGWGSIDAYNMVSDWLLVTPAGSTSTQGSTASKVTLSSTNSTVVSGNTITFTATVATAGTVTTVPTGTVQFLVDNVASGSAVTLVNGVATYTLATGTLTAGVHYVTAAYSGSTTYASSKATQNIDLLSATLADFSVTPTSSTITVASGHAGSGLTFTVNPVNGFVGNVTFTATPNVNLNASAGFSVNPVVISSSSASGSTVFTVYAYTTATTQASPLDKTFNLNTAALSGHSTPWQLAGSGVALAGLICLFLPGRRRRITGLLAAAFTISVLTMTGCSGSSGVTQSNAAAGTYTLTITATGTNAAGTSLSHSSNVTLIVQ